MAVRRIPKRKHLTDELDREIGLQSIGLGKRGSGLLLTPQMSEHDGLDPVCPKAGGGALRRPPRPIGGLFQPIEKEQSARATAEEGPDRGVVRIESDGAIDPIERLGRAPDEDQCPSESLVGVGKVRVELDRLFEFGDRRIELAP